MPFLLGKWIHLTVRQRIVAGYAAMLGVVALGAMIGWGLGNDYRQKSLKSYRMATAEREFLDDLQLAILAVRPGKQLLPLLDSPERFRQGSQVFLGRIESVQQLLGHHYHLHAEMLHSPLLRGGDLSPEALHHRLSDYQATANEFFRYSQSTFAKAQSLIGAADTQDQARQVITRLIQSETFRNYIDFPDELSNWIDQAEAREKLAEEQLLGAELLRRNITLLSVFVSLAIALLISWFVSKTIAKPIRDVIHQSKVITENSDFKQRMPAQRQDEIGDLSRTLNTLFGQVDLLLSQVNEQNVELREALKKLQNHKIIDDRMSSLNQVVAGVAHEINNPMTFIHSNIPHLEEYFEVLMASVRGSDDSDVEAGDDSLSGLDSAEIRFMEEDIPRIFASLKTGTSRVCQIVTSLRTFAHMDEAAFKQVDIHTGIDDTLMVLQHRLGMGGHLYDVELVKQYGDLPEVECYAGQMNQVFLNILVNALDALAEARGGEGETRLGHNDRILIETRFVSESRQVEIVIGNSGPAVDAQVQAKMFDPFFTTKPVGRGTGMGLAICHQIVAENHGGTLECISPAGEWGVKFVIRIPVRRACAVKPADRVDGAVTGQAVA